MKTTHNQILSILRDLKTKYPAQGMGKHISEAMMDYPNYWGMSDKEFLFALEKYVLELQENDPLDGQELSYLIDSSSSIEKLREGIDYEDLNEEDASEEE